MRKSFRQDDHRRDAQLAQCERKRWFETPEQAQDAAEQRMLDNMSVDLAIYRCPLCGYWHLTRRVDDL